MKRILPLLFAFLLVLGLSACGDSSKAPGIDTIRNTKTGDTISLGMSREKVEKKLGKGTPFDHEAFWKKIDELYPESKPSGEYEHVGRITPPPNNDATYGEDGNYLYISYENDTVIGFSTNSEDASSNWVLSDGITHGSPLADITNCFGEVKQYSLGTGVDGKNYSSLTYCYDASGKQVKAPVSASILVMIYLDESTNKLLAFSVEAYDPTPTIDLYKSIFEHKDEVQIFDVNNKDITQEVFDRHQSDYDKGDWQAIEDGLSALQISSISGPNEP